MDGSVTHLRGLQHYTPGAPDECWLWHGYIDPRGYGQMGYRNGKVWAHRMVYEDRVGPIAPGMQLDHIAEVCGNKSCVNPHHLEQVTHAENQRRAAQARIGKTRKCGHAYVSGESNCQVCNRERAARHRAAVKAGDVTPRRIVCTSCGQEADNCAKGLCRRCYTRNYKRSIGARPGAIPVHREPQPD